MDIALGSGGGGCSWVVGSSAPECPSYAPTANATGLGIPLSFGGAACFGLLPALCSRVGTRTYTLVGTRQTQMQIPPPFVILDRQLQCSKPRFPHLSRGVTVSPHLTGLVLSTPPEGVHALIPVTMLLSTAKGILEM